MFFTDEKLSELREKVKSRMSEKRFSHTLGVERCAKRLGELILPERVSELRAAALLHDISKEIPIDRQFEILENNLFPLTDEDRSTFGVIHSFTAPYVVKKDFQEFASLDILSAVYNHTLGCESMSVFDKIIFVSDYAEDTRPFASCVAVRNNLFDGIEHLGAEELLIRLDSAYLGAMNGALEALSRMGQPINSRIYIAKNSLEKKNLQI